MMKRLSTYFLRGLLFFVPVVGSVYLVFFVLKTLDSLLPSTIPGLGLGLLLLVILLCGALGSHVAGRAAFTYLESGIKQLPIVNLIYSSLKDLLSAFVGDRKSFDKPVMVNLIPEQNVRVFGFVTCDRFHDIRLKDQVAVYLPQSYNFAGNLIIVDKANVEPVDADSAQFLAFIVSGGVAEMNAARTFLDDFRLRRR